MFRRINRDEHNFKKKPEAKRISVIRTVFKENYFKIVYCSM